MSTALATWSALAGWLLATQSTGQQRPSLVCTATSSSAPSTIYCQHRVTRLVLQRCGTVPCPSVQCAPAAAPMPPDCNPRGCLPSSLSLCLSLSARVCVCVCVCVCLSVCLSVRRQLRARCVPSWYCALLQPPVPVQLLQVAAAPSPQCVPQCCVLRPPVARPFLLLLL